MLNIFERKEMKYVINRKRMAEILSEISSFISPNIYPHSSITSVYFDTPDYLMIRNSLSNKEFKEKIRLRSYGIADDTSPVFLESKKKYGGITYKRRQQMTMLQARDLLIFERKPFASQIMNELEYSLKGKSPKAKITYERDSFDVIDRSDMRITFDYEIRYDLNNYQIEKRATLPLTDDDCVIMEVKCLNSLPLWFTAFLDKKKLYPGSFSKYGEVYAEHIMKGGFRKCLKQYSHQYTQNSLSQLMSCVRSPQ